MADEQYESLLADELAAYQERLEAGDTDTVNLTLDTSLPPDVSERIAERKRCLAVLHWLHRAGQSATPDQIAGRVATPFGPPRSEPGGRFQRLEQLGSGGFGIVWRAREGVTGRIVALKVPRPEVLGSAELRKRFEQEAQAAARLDHPNIVAVLEAGSDGPVPYIASAYYDAPTLAEWLRDYPQGAEPRTAAKLVASLADAIDHAHDRGVLHRDVKPSNVMLVPRSQAGEDDASAFEPKLMDFGLAKLAEGPASELTRTGALMGTLQYMAPEQAAGRTNQITAATDIYGLGVVLYELLTGRTPFAGASDFETLRYVLEDEPPSLVSLRRDVPRDLAVICHKCLNKDSARRYRTARELADDLKRYLSGKPILAKPASTWERIVKWCRRNPQWAALIGFGLFAITVLIGVLSWSNVKVTSALAIAQRDREQARRYAYSADMRLAQENWEHGLPAESLALLERYLPRDGEEDLRGVEWRYLWSCSHRDSRVVARQPTAVWSLAVSPDDRLAATADRHGMLRLWQVDPPRPLGEWQAHEPDDIDALVFSGDGRTVISGANDHVIRFWDVATGTRTHELLEHKNWIGALALSKDQQYLASGDGDGRVLIWNAATAELVRELPKHPAAVRWLAFDATQPWLASGSEGGSVHLWDYLKNEEPPDAPGGQLEPRTDPRWRHGHFVPAHQGPLFASDGAQIVRWEVTAHHMAGKIARVTDTPWKILSLAVTSDALITGHEDSPEIQIRSHNGVLARRLVGHSDTVRCLAVQKDGRSFLSGSEDGTVRRWQPPASDESALSLQTAGRIDALDWSCDGKRLAVGSESGCVTLIEPAKSPQTQVVAEIGTGVRDVLMANKDDRVLVFDDEGHAWWTGKGISPIRLDLELTKSETWFDLDPLDRWLACTDQRTLHVMDAQSGRTVWKYTHPALISVRFLNERQLVTACHDGVVRVFDSKSGEVLRESHNYRSGCVWLAVSGDRRQLAVTCDRTVRMLDSETLQEVASFGRSKEPKRVDFFDNDRRLLVIDEDRLDIVNPETGQTLLSLPLRLNRTVLQFTQGETVAASRRKVLHVFPFRTSDLSKYLRPDGLD